jgi:uncharacterized Rmd1/YagE family protein
MTDHLNHRHGARMEWIIIALIAVEVVFECIHYWKHEIRNVAIVPAVAQPLLEHE